VTEARGRDRLLELPAGLARAGAALPPAPILAEDFSLLIRRPRKLRAVRTRSPELLS
jgi:hypothetical protein